MVLGAWTVASVVHALPDHLNHTVERAPTVAFRSNLDEHGTDYSDIWGYTAPDGREYALLGLYDGVAVINVTDRANPYEAGYLHRSESHWRDIKTFGHYAYCVNETASGLGVIDLSDPENPYARAPIRDFVRAHNLYVDEASATLYVAGWNGHGVRIYTLADPAKPEFLSTWNTAYAHDVMVQDGRMYVSAINGPAKLHIVDVSDPSNLVALGTVQYPNAKTHNAWVTPDGTHVMTTDEMVGGTCQFWDVTDPTHPVFADIYRPNVNTIPHNALIRGHLAFISHYELGVRVVDVTNRTAIREVGAYDTHPESDYGSFQGAWGVFPFFPNSPRLFVVSDIDKGLFVFELMFDPAYDERGGARDPAVDPAPSVSLARASRNPMRSGDTSDFAFALPNAGFVTARVVDVGGRLVRSLTSAGMPPGVHRLTWSGTDGAGSPVAAGTYYLVVRTPWGTTTCPTTVLR